MSFRPVVSAILFFGLVSASRSIAAADISVSPAKILQGDPVMVSVAADTPIARAAFDGRGVPIFSYGGKQTIFLGIDLSKAPGDYPLRLTFKNGGTVERMITVLKREKPEAPLGIPEKLGGNTTSSQRELVATLAQENAILAAVRTGKKAFWTAPFRYPVANPVVTDTYGYSRLTGAYAIAHKGADFRAPVGTKVFAMNRGVVRVARTFRSYGKTVVVDHGLGVHTLYLHLSKIGVNVGELVLPGQTIGRSGETGYALSPHLHVSVKIGGVSIDPVVFLSLVKN